EAGIDVAADLDRSQIRTDGGDLRRAARAAGTDARPRRELGQGRWRAGDQGVTGIHPRKKGREDPPRRLERRKVLGRMDRELRPTIEQGLLQLLHEHALPRW